MAAMPINMRFLKVQDGIMSYTLHSLKYFKVETSLKTWIRLRERFGKLRKLSTHEESKELYNTVSSGLAI